MPWTEFKVLNLLVRVIAGDILKVRETPKASRYQASDRKAEVAGLIASGKVTTLEDETMDDPQPSPTSKDKGQVQRLDGDGSSRDRRSKV